jgi:protein gp37
MADGTGIEWTDATWNPIRGCSRVSEGCRNCYAEGVARRFNGEGLPYEGLTTIGRWNGTVRVVESALDQPLRWKRPRKIFVNSMSDLFHESLPFADIARIFAVMQLAQLHTFQVLTKRAERMRDFFRWLETSEGKQAWLKAVVTTSDVGKGTTESWSTAWPFRNVWLGVSVENQAAAEERIPLLLETPAAVRFLSCEPLLGPVDLARLADDELGAKWNAIASGRLHWVIAGGESGKRARPMHASWARSLRDQCSAVGVPFFFKQWGEWAPMVHLAVTPDGEQLVGDPRHSRGRQAAEASVRIGKKAAGSILDGVDHKDFPLEVL